MAEQFQSFPALLTSGVTSSGTQSTKYSVENATWPSDLFSNAELYAKTWVMFNINVQQNSLAAKTQTTISLDKVEQDKANLMSTNAANRGNSAIGAATTVAAAGAAIGGAGNFSMSGAINNPMGTATSMGGGATKGLVAGAAAGIPFLASGTAVRATKRLKAAIQLPMPNNISSNYLLNWDMDNTLLFDLIMRTPALMGQGINALTDKSAQSISSLAADVGAATVLGTLNLAHAGGISAATGLAANPKKESVFQGVNFRTFSLEYRMFPKSLAEAEKIRNIIYLFKYHAHPEYLGPNRFTFIYPSEFDITFYQGTGIENQFVTRIGTCILRDVVVNYTADGLWATHEEGVPNAINLNLTFQELGIITKEAIEQGF